jgi:N utilization substance protein A
MTTNAIMAAIQQICDEKGLKKELVIETIEAALAAAFRKDFGNKEQNIKVQFNPETGGARVFDEKTVVEDIDLEELEKEREKLHEQKEDWLARKKEAEKVNQEFLEPDPMEISDIKRYNPKTDIMMAEAKKIDKKADIGDVLTQELEVPSEYGRVAAQTAKQVIIQKLREVERDTIFNDFKTKEGELLNGTIQRIEGRTIFVDLGKAFAILPPDEQMSTEQYRPGLRLKVFIVSVTRGNKGPEIIASRSHPDMLRKLFAMEVPEIMAETVEIKAISREAGARSKIAVIAHQDNIDPIGSCVGQRGTRVQTVINELNGEKIDIIEWNENIEQFIANALSPAQILTVKLNEADHKAIATVKEDQLSLAIGKAGQNVRLAAKLTGWKIDIASEKGEVVEILPEEKIANENEVDTASEKSVVASEKNSTVTENK